MYHLILTMIIVFIAILSLIELLIYSAGEVVIKSKKVDFLFETTLAIVTLGGSLVSYHDKLILNDLILPIIVFVIFLISHYVRMKKQKKDFKVYNVDKSVVEKTIRDTLEKNEVFYEYTDKKFEIPAYHGVIKWKGSRARSDISFEGKVKINELLLLADQIKSQLKDNDNREWQVSNYSLLGSFMLTLILLVTAYLVYNMKLFL